MTGIQLQVIYVFFNLPFYCGLLFDENIYLQFANAFVKKVMFYQGFPFSQLAKIALQSSVVFRKREEPALV